LIESFCKNINNKIINIGLNYILGAIFLN